jgi:hypothetical protein
MFGHQDDKDDKSLKKDDKENIVAPDEANHGAVNTETADQTDQAAPSDANAADNADTDNSADSAAATDAAPESDDTAWQHPGVPIDDKDPEDNGPEQITDIIGPAGGGNLPSYKPPIVGGSGHHGYSGDDDNNAPQDLIDIKQKALSELMPLIDKLDQTPEDRFRTTMMIIQSSDDQSLVKKAFESAEAIEDEKLRGQALLDIINEINYFTQHPQPESGSES